jgi:uncharacterized RDD family membrane protein YckC
MDTTMSTPCPGKPERPVVRVCQGARVRALAFAVDLFVLSWVFLFIALAVFTVLAAQGRFAVPGEEPFPWYLWLAFSIAAFLYFWVAEARYGKTAGKRLFDLYVVSPDGRRVGYGAVFVRTALRIVDWLPALCLLGALLIAVTPNRQRLGDLAAGTCVVRERRASLEAIEAQGLVVVPWPEAQDVGEAALEERTTLV